MYYSKAKKRVQIKNDYDNSDKGSRDLTKEEVKQLVRIMIKLIVSIYVATIKRLSAKEQ